MLILPYILPMMLGRTFDLDTMKVGVDIFSKEVIDNRKIFDRGVYSLVAYHGSVDYPHKARSILFGDGDIERALALKVKVGIVNAGASGEYLSDHFDRTNTVEIVVQETYERASEYIAYDAKPIPTWKSYGKLLGTHYVSSITYGGEIVASIRFQTNSSTVKEMVKRAVETPVLLQSQKELHESIKDILKLVDSTEIKVFSSIPLTEYPKDLDSLKRTLKEFPKYYNQYNGGRGLPIKVELSPLKNLDPARSDIIEKRAKDWSLFDMPDFERKFSDLLQTKTAMSEWMKRLEKPLTEEQEQKVGDFYSNLENALGVFYEIIGKLDLSQGPDQLKKSEELYDWEKLDAFFYNQYLQLRQEVEKDEEDDTNYDVTIEVNPL